MEQDVRQPPPLWELLLVESIAFGYFSLISLLCVLNFNGQVSMDVNDSYLLSMAFHELFFFLVACWILKIRGWKMSDFGMTVNWPLTGGGFLLWLITYILFFIAFDLVYSLSGDPEIFDNVTPVSDVSFPVALLPILINSIFEELFVTAYIVKVLKTRNDLMFVIGFSVLIRLLYHLYQGPIIITSILPMGVLFAWTYYKWEKLWPLIVAHSIWNVMAFSLN